MMNADKKQKQNISPEEIRPENDHLQGKTSGEIDDDKEEELNREATEKANDEKELNKI